MLASLSIKNYAIIKNLTVEFDNGFSVITGETGAGKSIIMGALSLIIGQRADTSVLYDKDNKCVVEGKFFLNDKIDLTQFFEENDLDYDKTVFLRREITTAGKTRAFVNDTPVSISILRELGLKLIDIHSQHSNLDLGKHQFQLNIVDWYADNSPLVFNYSQLYATWRKLIQTYKGVKEKAEKSKTDLDYFLFQFNQLDEAKLKDGELVKLEQEHEMLTHSEEIKTGLNQVVGLLDAGEINVISSLKECLTIVAKLKTYLPNAINLHERLDSQLIELRDITEECEILAEKTEHDPDKLEQISARLNLLYSLLQKHRVETVEQLIVLRNDFDDKIQASASFDEELLALEKQIVAAQEKVAVAAEKLHHSREKCLPQIEQEIKKLLVQLGMPNAMFKIELIKIQDYTLNGNNEVNFLFNANKGGQLEEINKVASGGELSRLMLAIKTVVAKSKALPAIIFDEIDTGISGEIALKMGDILKEMAEFMQVINITHLPQIASKGTHHYFVYKIEQPNMVETNMRILNRQERIEEIAKMLSGDKPSDAAIENAKVLLGS